MQVTIIPAVAGWALIGFVMEEEEGRNPLFYEEIIAWRVEVSGSVEGGDQEEYVKAVVKDPNGFGEEHWQFVGYLTPTGFEDEDGRRYSDAKEFIEGVRPLAERKARDRR